MRDRIGTLLSAKIREGERQDSREEGNCQEQAIAGGSKSRCS